jgi:hypothetical protein
MINNLTEENIINKEKNKNDSLFNLDFCIKLLKGLLSKYPLIIDKLYDIKIENENLKLDCNNVIKLTIYLIKINSNIIGDFLLFLF